MIRQQLKYILALFLFVSFTGINSQGSVEDEIAGYVNKYCSASQKDEKIWIFKRIFAKLPKSAQENGIKAVELILPQVCLSNYPSWLVDRTLNLALYGISEGKLEESTIEYLTEMIPSVSIGKVDVITFGRLMENMVSTGIPRELIVDFFHTALESNVTRVRIDALAYYYTQELTEKLTHKIALANALDKTGKVPAYGDKYVMLEAVFNTDPEKTIKPSKKTEEEMADLEKKWLKFWKNHKNKVRYKEKFERVISPIPPEEVAVKLKTKTGIPYGYRVNRGNAVDITGLVSFLTGEKISDLPLQTDTYCTPGATFSSPKNLHPGDLVFFNSSGKKSDYKAVGVYLESNEFILITHARGVEVFSLDDQFFGKNFIKACRILK